MYFCLNGSLQQLRVTACDFLLLLICITWHRSSFYKKVQKKFFKWPFQIFFHALAEENRVHLEIWGKRKKNILVDKQEYLWCETKQWIRREQCNDEWHDWCRFVRNSLNSRASQGQKLSVHSEARVSQNVWQDRGLVAFSPRRHPLTAWENCNGSTNIKVGKNKFAS